MADPPDRPVADGDGPSGPEPSVGVPGAEADARVRADPAADRADAPTDTSASEVTKDAVAGARDAPGNDERVRSRQEGFHLDPFRIGFVGALGVFTAVALVQAVVNASQVVTLLFVSLFLALGLDPLVKRLQNWGFARGAAVSVTFLLMVAVVTGFLWMIVPVVVQQATDLAENVPRYIDRIERLEPIQEADEQYGLFERVNTELEARLTSGETVQAVFGGVLGAGRAVVTGVFSVLTVLILTLYFLVSLPSMTSAMFRLAPASRRERIEVIATQARRRIGGYVLGQLAIASLNGVLSFIVMAILQVEFAAALAFAVAVLGLIPLVGATIGAILVAIVTTVASFGSAAPDAGLLSILTVPIILVIWFIFYQQIENYIIAPRIFARSVRVPGTVAIVAALIGGSLLGLLGALVAVPVAAVILLIVQDVVMPIQDRR